MVWSDNTAAEATTRKGTARSFDHLCIVHAIWLRAAQLHTELHIRRVPTDVNISDDPSREKCANPFYQLAHGLRFSLSVARQVLAP